MLDVDGKEWWQVCEQCQIMSRNLCKSIQTPTSYDHVEFWISQHGNSLFFLPTTLTNSLFSRWTISPLPRWMASSLRQQMASLPGWMVSLPLLNERPPPSVNKRSLPLLNEQHSTNSLLPPSTIGLLFPSMNGLFPCSTNGLLPCSTNGLFPCSTNGLLPVGTC